MIGTASDTSGDLSHQQVVEAWYLSPSSKLSVAVCCHEVTLTWMRNAELVRSHYVEADSVEMQKMRPT